MNSDMGIHEINNMNSMNTQQYHARNRYDSLATVNMYCVPEIGFW